MMLFDLPTWATGFNFLTGLFTVALMVGGAYLVLLARSKNDVSGLQTDRAIAAEAILKVRDAELVSALSKLKDAESELEDITAEHRTLVGLTVGELLEFWGQKEAIEAKILMLERQIRILKKAGGDEDI